MSDQEIVENIVDIDVEQELSESFLAYSMSVIVSRALPDVRDGLKPVQRRILYAMLEEGMRPEGGHRKSAVPVGTTMGRYHPHGDAAIYDALVRMTQPFRLRLPLIDPHGNFGSLDDGPAAPRYTECKLAHAGMLLLDNIREDSVDFDWNYNNEYKEPVVLPAAFPNLLVNGGSGIAVGMASNMPPHNLGEVVEGLKALLKRPDMTLDELMVHIPGPDLPTGANIIDGGALKEAYKNGRGIFKMRGTSKIEDITARKRGIVFTSLPYNVGPERVIEKVKDAVKAGKLLGIADIKDLSNLKHGTKLVIECKTGFNPQAVLEELYRQTPLEDSFGVNNVCLVNRRPETLGLVALCKHYLEHRMDVIIRRTRFRLNKAQARAHILEGLILALASIDEVVAIIRKSKDTVTAKKALVKNFTLTDIQADAILEMRLARLTSLEVNKLKDELKELNKQIAGYQKLLSDENARKDLIAEELDLVVEKVGTPRRSRILSDIPAAPAAAALEIEDEPTRVVLTTNNLIGRYEPVPNKAKLTKSDLVRSSLDTTTRATIGAVTSRGRLLRQGVVELPKAEGRSRGGEAREYFSLDREKIVGLIPLEAGKVLTMVTRDGAVKRLLTDALPSPKTIGAPVIGLKEGDELVSVMVSDAQEELDLIIVSSAAQLLRTSVNAISPKGAPAGAMAGIKLAEDARVLAAGLIGPEDETSQVLTLSNGDGFKRSKAQEYPSKGRGGGGVRCQTFRKAETELIAAWVGGPEAYGIGENGEPVNLPEDVSRRDASGVKLETTVVEIAPRRA